jgi:hypothetical protein
MRSSKRRLYALLASSALFAALLLGTTNATAVSFTLDTRTLESFLKAATPYELVIGKGGISETLTLSTPREVKFTDGKIRLKIDCRGTPLPIDVVLEPVMTIQWSETKKAYEAKVESLPLKIPSFGTYDLAQYMRPIEIPQVFAHAAGEGGQAMLIEGKIESLKVLETAIEVSADVSFRKAPAAAQPAPAASKTK